MAANNLEPSQSAEELTAKVHKRYEGLLMVRTKAIKGKGAWYWAHLEPMLVHNSDSNLPKAVKLKCSLCDAVFSASNPSRTASEHLKRGTCPNFTSVQNTSQSISPPYAALPASSSSPQQHHNRKRTSPTTACGGASHVSPLAMVGPSLLPQQHLMLSGGKEDLGALAMFEDSVKRLKSPKSSPGPVLSKTQIDSALDYLAEWVYESCGSVSLSSLEHPKFRLFLNQVGMPAIDRRDFAGGRLDAKFEEAKFESEARIRDAMFFQMSSNGWKKSKNFDVLGEENVVNLTVNLPNGTSVFRRAFFTAGSVSPNYVEEIIMETITGICGNHLRQCVGIVSDKFSSDALRNLENRNHWMVNISCQFQGFTSLIKDFNKELLLLKNVTENCFKISKFFNNNSQVRNGFLQYQSKEYGQERLIRVGPNFATMEDILNYAQAIQLVLLDESIKVVSMEDPLAREVAEMVRGVGFWNELEAAHSLIKLVKTMAQEIETERPLVGRCLPLWEELRAKVKDWCSKYQIPEMPLDKVIEKRFKKNYHPAWAAAYILDPFYLIRDTSGKYLPPFKKLSIEQEKDVDRLITRLVSREEAHIALMELMKWRTEGLDPVYAQAVQLKQRDPVSGKMKIANPQSSRLVWETYLTEFKSLAKVAVRLIFLHATSCGFKCNLSFLRWVCGHNHSRVGTERAQKMIFIAAHAKLEKRDFSNDEEKDAELFASENESFHRDIIELERPP